MKKLATLLLAAGMVVASTAPANAVDIKVDARYRASFATGSVGFAGENSEQAMHRLRLGLTMAASENLSGYAQFQFGTYNWGTATNNAGGQGWYNEKVTARMMYIDWTVPTTAVKVRMGRHQFGLPAEAFGQNSILGAGYGTREGVVVTAPVTDWLGLTGIWARLAANGTDTDQADNTDMFALAANLKFEGVSGAVYAAYASVDEKEVDSFAYDSKDGTLTLPGVGYSNDNGGLSKLGEGDAYWLGFTSTFTLFDPFTLKLSAAYGEFNSRYDDDKNQNGWNVQAKASYALPFGTPVLGAFYFSGADEDGKGLMPNAGYFVATRGYHDGACGLGGLQATGDIMGLWGVQAGIEGVSFLEGLSHDFVVTYMQGTNDEKVFEDGKLVDRKSAEFELGEDDSLVEFNLVNTYKIYKNLAAHLELSYIISDFDNDGATKTALTEDDWCAQLTFEYKF